MKGRRITEQILSVFYPPRCAVCGDIRPEWSILTCPECREGFQKVKGPRCFRCGKHVEDERQEYCYDCSHKKFRYLKGFPLWQYDKKLQRSIIEFKYQGRKEYAAYYAEELVKAFGTIFLRVRPDVLVPVPVHRSRLKKRGYNQAEVITRELSERLGIPMLTGYLIRVKKTLPQKELDDRERFRNLSEAFSISKDCVLERVPECVLLVDDIYTTGSTVETCSRVLYGQGVKRVYYTSIGIGRGD